MLPPSRSYDELIRGFQWQVPAQFNIGLEVCDRWAERDPGKLAIVATDADGQARHVSYGWLRDTSNRLANALAAHRIARGDRVAILLPQGPEVAAIHIAIYKLGAIALPLAILFGTTRLPIGCRTPAPRRSSQMHSVSPNSPRSAAHRAMLWQH
jgi:acetyl-CoA synthetase